MPLLSEPALFFLLFIVQLLGLGSLAGVRLRGDSNLHSLFRVTFLCSLVAVGLATMFAVGCGSGWWISCGTTLSLMSVGGTIDLGHA